MEPQSRVASPARNATVPGFFYGRKGWLLLWRVVIFTVIPAQAGIYGCRFQYRSAGLRD